MRLLQRTLCLLASLGSLLGSGSAQAARPADAHSSSRHHWPVVVGLDGQSDLVLDRGRSLRAVPLGKTPGCVPKLNSLEKCRLDARRIAFASSLSPDEQLLRLAAIVRHRFPVGDREEQRYLEVSEALHRQQGCAPLSKYVQRKAGLCRERAWLLATLLKEVGVHARVRYGELYDNAGKDLGGHAWVEGRLDQQRFLLDPSLSNSLQTPQRSTVKETLLDGTSRRITAAVTAGLVYVPTADLRLKAAR